MSAVCTVAGGAAGAEVLLAACGLGGSCCTACCWAGVETGMNAGAAGTGGMLESAGLGIMTPGCMVVGVGSAGCMG